MNEATILYEGNQLIQENEFVKHYVANAQGDFRTLFKDNKLTVVIKEIGKENQSGEKVRMIAGDIARELGKSNVETAVVNKTSLEEMFPAIETGAAITAFVEGWDLGQYSFSTYKSEKDLYKTELKVEGEDAADGFVKEGRIRAEATAFSRDLMNEIPSALNPATFPSVLEKEFSGTDVEINVLNKQMLEEKEMNGILTVGRGSIHEPAFVEMTYCGDESKPLVALVGKGVTFDTGGITLKRGKDLSNMRFDMGGAAAVAGAMKLLSETKQK